MGEQGVAHDVYLERAQRAIMELILMCLMVVIFTFGFFIIIP